MPSKSAEIPLRDILHHIDLAGRFVAGIDYAAFHDDARTVYAVTRCLEIISEASRRCCQSNGNSSPGGRNEPKPNPVYPMTDCQAASAAARLSL
jgi:uncharacterized protein with HEPN domain